MHYILRPKGFLSDKASGVTLFSIDTSAEPLTGYPMAFTLQKTPFFPEQRDPLLLSIPVVQ